MTAASQSQKTQNATWFPRLTIQTICEDMHNTFNTVLRQGLDLVN